MKTNIVIIKQLNLSVLKEMTGMDRIFDEMKIRGL